MKKKCIWDSCNIFFYVRKLFALYVYVMLKKGKKNGKQM